MIPILLRPLVLSYKNKLLRRSREGHWLSIESVVLFISTLVMFGLFYTGRTILAKLVENPEFHDIVPVTIFRMSLIFFFCLLLVSSFIGAIGVFFEAKDMPLYLSAPISSFRLYSARFIETLVGSSWMFVLFGLPVLFAYTYVFHLPPAFILVNILAGIPLLVIATAIGVSFAILFVNLVPVVKLTDVLAVFGFVGVFALLVFEQGVNLKFPAGERNFHSLAATLSQVHDPGPAWIPPAWNATLAEHYLLRTGASLFPAIFLLLSTALASFALGFFIFDTLFLRGWTLASAGAKKISIRGSATVRSLGRALLPMKPQLRAILYKEARMFVRDTVQALQLLFILTVTCLYIYNFRALRYVANLGQESHNWLHVFLSLVNIGFGGSVVAAVATRFVFPSISLEGRAYSLIRSAPISVEQYMRYKFYVWAVPLMFLSVTLVVSGSMALQVSPEVVFVSAILSLPIAFSTVAIAIGLGGVYVRLDWDSPSQVTSSFGSLVHMLLSMATIGASLVPACYVYIVVLVPNFSQAMSVMEYLVSMACALFLVFYVNFTAAHLAMKAGAQTLRDLER